MAQLPQPENAMPSTIPPSRTPNAVQGHLGWIRPFPPVTTIAPGGTIGFA